MILLLTGGLLGRAGTPSVMSWPLQKLLPRRHILLLADCFAPVGYHQPLFHGTSACWVFTRIYRLHGNSAKHSCSLDSRIAKYTVTYYKLVQ